MMISYPYHASEIFPPDFVASFRLDMPSWRFGHPTSIETIKFLAGLVKFGCVPVVEFGTFTGRTTYNMALNTQEKIYTIDIGRDMDHAASPKGHGYDAYVPGEAFLGTEAEARIELILGDSREVDLSHLYGTIGLVFIDGGHSYEVVKSDTEKAFKLIRPDGVIVWDDVNDDWPGTVKAIKELPDERMIHLEKECLLFYYGPAAKVRVDESSEAA